MDRSHEIADFVLTFLTAHGVDAQVDEAGVLTAELPPALANELGVAQRLRLSFSLSKKGEGAERAMEFLTDGHPLLDRMLAVAKTRGEATSLLLTFALDRDFLDAMHAWDPFRKAASRESGSRERLAMGGDRGFGRLSPRLSRLSFPDASVRVLERRIVYHTQVMFRFKVSMTSDDKRELIVALWIDPVTEEVDRSVDLRGATTFYLWPSSDPVQEEYRLDRLYRRACVHLEKRLQPTIRAYRQEVDARLKAELRRIEEYYSGLIQEQVEPLRKLFRRMAVASVRADLARSWNTENRYREALAELKMESDLLEAQYQKEFASLQREKAQRIVEVREKHQPKVEVALIQAAVVRIPRIEWRLRLARQSARREVTLLVDVLRRRLVDWVCESCTDSLGDVVLVCGCSAIVCEGCHRECAGCGRSYCRSCSTGLCHVCHDPVCPDCQTACPIVLQTSDIMVCGRCRDEWCPQCRSLSFFHTGEITGSVVPPPPEAL